MILTFTQIKYKELISGGIRYVGPSIVQARQAAIGKTGGITKPRRRSKPASMCEAGGGVALSAAESVPQLEFQGCPTAWRCGVDSFVGTRQRWNLSDVSRHTSAAVLTRLRRQSSKLTNVNRPV